MNQTQQPYQHILVGVDLSEEAPLVLAKAVNMARACNAKLSIVHVLEPVSFAYGGDIPIDISEIQTAQTEKAETILQNLAHSIDLPIERSHVLSGQPATEMHALALQENADLIIVGSHGRKGFALLLGSTPNSILHGATCDVLATLVSETTAER